MKKSNSIYIIILFLTFSGMQIWDVYAQEDSQVKQYNNLKTTLSKNSETQEDLITSGKKEQLTMITTFFKSYLSEQKNNLSLWNLKDENRINLLNISERDNEQLDSIDRQITLAINGKDLRKRASEVDSLWQNHLLNYKKTQGQIIHDKIVELTGTLKERVKTLKNQSDMLKTKNKDVTGLEREINSSTQNLAQVESINNSIEQKLDSLAGSSDINSNVNDIANFFDQSTGLMILIEQSCNNASMEVSRLTS